VTFVEGMELGAALVIEGRADLGATRVIKGGSLGWRRRRGRELAGAAPSRGRDLGAATDGAGRGSEVENLGKQPRSCFSASSANPSFCIFWQLVEATPFGGASSFWSF
jgi:hypothetical protein